MVTMEQGNLRNQAASTHTVKEQFVLAEYRDIASSNADNEFNRAIDEENVDFIIPGVPNSDGETITWRQRSQLDSEDREPPSATSTSKVIFNNIDHSTLSAKNHKT